MGHSFSALREQYPEFIYEAYTIAQLEGELRLTFHFSIPGLCSFAPQTCIPTENLGIANDPDSPLARQIVFALGLVEAVSYWKCTCAPRVVVRCGFLDAWDAAWWKTLWFHGLGEFFYCNGINTSFAEFVTFESTGSPAPGTAAPAIQRGRNLIPVGGGKDSCVTLDLLQGNRANNRLFTINDQPARTECALAAGYRETDIVRTLRTIDPQLLERNREGFLNGHTPFSAVVAFLAYYCAYLIGAQNIVLSNESSANTGNVAGSTVNHQYSKSFAFEQDFRAYTARHFAADIQYFSLLRCYNELQIAKRFSALPQFFKAFKSCNVGSKQNIWCGACAKCLFVYCILSPFVCAETLTGIFGENLLEKPALRKELDALCAFTPVKPFECVGTAEEVRAALELTCDALTARGDALPLLLRHYKQKAPAPQDAQALLHAYNGEHAIPPELLPPRM